jgi:hypothetical protein
VPPILLFVMIIAIAMSWPSAWAHDWYPKHCCSGRDCAPLAFERVKVTPEGYVIDGVFFVAHSKALWSPDEWFHGCFPGNKKVLGCFWAPRPAM